MDTSHLLIPIIVMMVQKIIKSQNQVFWIDFFNEKIVPIFVEDFFVLAPKLQYLVRKFFVQFLVQSEFENIDRIVLHQTIVEMSEDDFFKFLKHNEQNLVSLLGLAKEYNLDYIPPCVDELSPTDIAVNSKESMDKYLTYVKQTTTADVKILCQDYIKRLRLLLDANFWLIHYFQVEERVDSKINFEWFDEDRKKKVLIYKQFCKNPKLKYVKSLNRFTLYSNFLQRNPEFLVKPVKSLHKEWKTISDIKKKKPCERKIVPHVIEEPVPKPLDLSGIDFDKLIPFILSCLNFQFSSYMTPRPNEDDKKELEILLRLAIAKILSCPFTKRVVCQTATELFNQHVIVALESQSELSKCQMSMANKHFNKKNCWCCWGCDNIGNVSKYGAHSNLVPNAFRKILLLTCFGEYHSFFSFLMFLCQINRRFCQVTNAPSDFKELQNFLKVVFGIHYHHHSTDLAILLKNYQVNYSSQNIVTMTYSLQDFYSMFHITDKDCAILVRMKEESDSKASERQAQSNARETSVLEGRWNDEIATGLPWNHPLVPYILDGGERSKH